MTVGVSALPGMTERNSTVRTASWLLPAALIGLFVGLVLTWRAVRTDRVRAGLLLWGGWLLVTGAVFSFMAGTVHPYYNVALAPAVALRAPARDPDPLREEGRKLPSRRAARLRPALVPATKRRLRLRSFLRTMLMAGGHKC